MILFLLVFQTAFSLGVGADLIIHKPRQYAEVGNAINAVGLTNPSVVCIEAREFATTINTTRIAHLLSKPGKELTSIPPTRQPDFLVDTLSWETSPLHDHLSLLFRTETRPPYYLYRVRP